MSKPKHTPPPLIAAAPDLLEALETIVGMVASDLPADSRLLDNYRKLIAKAKGAPAPKAEGQGESK